MSRRQSGNQVKVRASESKFAIQAIIFLSDSPGVRHQGEEAEILPVLWQDNYIELMPDESREIIAQFLSRDTLNGQPELTVDGWNVERSILPLNQSMPPTADLGAAH